MLDDDTAAMSERGTANLLGIRHVSLRSVVAKGFPKVLTPFIDKGLSVVANSVNYLYPEGIAASEKKPEFTGLSIRKRILR